MSAAVADRRPHEDRCERCNRRFAFEELSFVKEPPTSRASDPYIWTCDKCEERVEINIARRNVEL